MRGLADLRVLVLLGPVTHSSTPALIKELSRRTTSHILLVTGRTLPITLLRVLKRLALGQDDAIMVLGTPLFGQLLFALAARLGRRPALVVLAGRPRGPAQRITRMTGAVPVPAGPLDAVLRALARLTRRAWP